ncbi:hypothetical protein [uncultured Roseobacter sp.]|uniref:spike base protein, RCAP_Rcc01079 family n=1 Tax=uncultured Roseobacter sp. TaxID=114847 RepID=UPI0026183E0A|nr:hypothetical protein [uncultured Roseobacter sp.]
MSDRFSSYSIGLESPAINLHEVTPDDGADLPQVSRALNVAGGGTVRVTTVAGDTATVTVAAGIPFPVRVRRIWATGTSATGIVAMS